MKLRASNSDFHPLYQEIDRDSARCRVNLITLQKYFPIGRIGSIIKMKITIQEGQEGQEGIYLTTLWPDIHDTLEEAQVALSPIISLQSSTEFQWMEGYCEILEVIQQPKVCSSFRIDRFSISPGSGRYISSPSLAGLPVVSGCEVSLSYLPQKRLLIRRTNPDVSCQISIHSICMFEERTLPTNNLPFTEQQTNHMKAVTFSRTNIVQEIIQRVIEPTLQQVPPTARFTAMMLLGPPGTGKTFAVKAVQHICQSLCKITIHSFSIPEMLAEANPGEFLKNKINSLDKAFQTESPSQLKWKKTTISPFIMKNAETSSPMLSSPSPRGEKDPFEVHFIQIDEIDGLGTPQHHNESQIAIKLILVEWIDRLVRYNTSTRTVCVIATSNRSDDIDRIFRRGGRLEYELYALNTAQDRCALILSYIKSLSAEIAHLEGESGGFSKFLRNLDQEELLFVASAASERTGGYVAADISALVQSLPQLFIEFCKNNPIPPQTSSSQLLLDLIDHAREIVQPSCLRGITVNLPKLSFEDIIGYETVKQQLFRAFQYFSPAMKANFEKFHLSQSLGGILLHGPPGNSKTRLVNACASVFRLPLIALTSADIYSAYVGDAEAEIRKAFTIARQASPCILFFDEMDSLVTNRNQSFSSSAANPSSSSSTSVEARVLATFLNEMDGVTTHAASSGVIVMGATNRLDCIDPALIRKGRFYQVIHIPSPNEQERIEILEYYLQRYDRNQTMMIDRDLLAGKLFEGMSGAEIENLCKLEIVNKMTGK